MSQAHEWHEIMDGLSGRRLAVYDDLRHARPVALDAPIVQNALGWLVHHRFVYRDEQGELATRSIPAAREKWLSEGVARDAGQILNELPERGGSAAPLQGVEGRAGDKAAPRPAQIEQPTPGQEPGPRAVHTPRPIQQSLF